MWKFWLKSKRFIISLRSLFKMSKNYFWELCRFLKIEKHLSSKWQFFQIRISFSMLSHNTSIWYNILKKVSLQSSFIPLLRVMPDSQIWGMFLKIMTVFWIQVSFSQKFHNPSICAKYSQNDLTCIKFENYFWELGLFLKIEKHLSNKWRFFQCCLIRLLQYGTIFSKRSHQSNLRIIFESHLRLSKLKKFIKYMAVLSNSNLLFQ